MLHALYQEGKGKVCVFFDLYSSLSLDGDCRLGKPLLRLYPGHSHGSQHGSVNRRSLPCPALEDAWPLSKLNCRLGPRRFVVGASLVRGDFWIAATYRREAASSRRALFDGVHCAMCVVCPTAVSTPNFC